MSLVFDGSMGNHYRVVGTKFQETLSDNWIIGCQFTLDNEPVNQQVPFQLGRDTDPGRISISFSAIEDKLTVSVGDYSTYFNFVYNYTLTKVRVTGGIGESYIYEPGSWLYVVIQKGPDGVNVYFDKLGSPIKIDPWFVAGVIYTEPLPSAPTALPWYRAVSPNKLDLFIGEGHDGTNYVNHFKGSVGEVFFVQTTDHVEYRNIVHITQGSLHPMDLPNADVVFYYTFKTANDIEYDLVHGHEAIKSGTVDAGPLSHVGDVDSRTVELLEKPTEPAGYRIDPVDMVSMDTDWGTDLTVGFMCYIPEDPTESYEILSMSMGEDDGFLNAIHVSYVHTYYDEDDAAIIVKLYHKNKQTTRVALTQASFGTWNYIQIVRYFYSNYTYATRVTSVPIGASSVGSVPHVPPYSGEPWYPKHFFIGNGPRLDSNQVGHVAQFFCANTNLNSNTTILDIANGRKYITDLATDEEILWWYQLDTGDKVERCMVHGTPITMFGDVQPFDHPITPLNREGIYGDFPSITGLWDATHVRSQDIKGNLPAFEGDFLARQYEVPILDGVFPAIDGYFKVSVGNARGDVLGVLPRFVGKLSAGIPNKLIGTLPSALMFGSGRVSPPNYLTLSIGAIDISISATNQGTVFIEPLLVSEDMFAVSISKILVEMILVRGVSTSTYVYAAATLERALASAKANLIQNSHWVDQASVRVAGNVFADFMINLNSAAGVIAQLVALQASEVNLTEVVEALSGFFTSYLKTIQETLLLGEATNSTTTLTQHLTASLTTSALEEGFITLTTLLLESLGASAAQSVLQNIAASVTESLSAQFYIELSGETYLATVLNTDTDALWHYDNYGFNSFNDNLGAKDDGIYLLSGHDDYGSNIDASFDTAYTHLGSRGLNRLSGGLYLGLANDGPVRIKVTTSRNGVAEEDWYEETKTLGAYDTSRVNVHDGVTSHYWKFSVSNHEGSAIDLDTLHMYPVLLTRGIR